MIGCEQVYLIDVMTKLMYIDYNPSNKLQETAYTLEKTI